jgi:hypothetical protein
MATTTTVRSWSAMRARLSAWRTPPTRGHPSLAVRLIYLVLGTFFAGLTARVLLWEVHGVANLTADHLLTIGAVVGAIAAGIFFWHMLWSCKFGAALGLGIAFAAATTYCLIGSAGRGDEAAFEKNAAARQINEDRERYQRDLKEAKARYQAAMDAETQECSGGAGQKCISKRATTKERRSDYEVAELLVRQQKAEARERQAQTRRRAHRLLRTGRAGDRREGPRPDLAVHSAAGVRAADHRVPAPRVRGDSPAPAPRPSREWDCRRRSHAWTWDRPTVPWDCPTVGPRRGAVPAPGEVGGDRGGRGPGLCGGASQWRLGSAESDRHRRAVRPAQADRLAVDDQVGVGRTDLADAGRSPQRHLQKVVVPTGRPNCANWRS